MKYLTLCLLLALLVGCKSSKDKYHLRVAEISKNYFYSIQPHNSVTCICWEGSKFVIEYTKDDWKTSKYLSVVDKNGILKYIGFDDKGEAVKEANRIITLDKCESAEREVEAIIDFYKNREAREKENYERSKITIIK